MLQVRRSFNRAAASYRQAAEVQSRVAARLTEMLNVRICDKALEVGCGDGLFTEQLVRKVNIHNLLVLDIALASLQRMQPHLAKLRILADGQALPIRPGSMDLLVSSSALQWFTQPERSIPELLKCLRTEGSFFFSVFCHGTFAEMEQVNQRTGFGKVYPLPSEHDLLRIIQQTTGAKVEMQVETITQTYPNVMQFLRSQQLTGAGYSGAGKTCGRKALERFIRVYEDQFSVAGRISVSYRIAYFRGLSRF